MYFARRKNNRKLIGGLLVAVFFTSLFLYFIEQKQSKYRDFRRFADMKQMQTVLNYHYELYGEYPRVAEFACFSEIESLIEGLVPWLVTLPIDPSKGTSPIDSDNACYNYRSDDGRHYKLRSILENNDFSMLHDNGSSDEWYEIFTAEAARW